MKSHKSVVDKLIHLYSTYGGYRDEKKLRDQLTALQFTTYTKQSGEVILVLAEDIAAAKVEANKNR